MLPDQGTIAAVLWTVVAVMTAVVVITERVLDRRDKKRKNN